MVAFRLRSKPCTSFTNIEHQLFGATFKNPDLESEWVVTSTKRTSPTWQKKKTEKNKNTQKW